MTFTPPTLLGLLVLGCLAAAARADEWPQWGGSPARNMVSPAKGVADTFEPPRTVGGIESAGTGLLWQAKLGTLTYGSPVVAGGKVFIATNDARPQDPRHRTTAGGLLMCFDSASGKFLWELPTPRLKSVDNFDHMNLGLCSTPTVDGNRLYVVSSRCEVLCIDVNGLADGNDGPFKDEAAYMGGEGAPIATAANDGDIIWRYDIVSQNKVWPHDCADCSILIDGDILYVCTSNGVDRSHRNVPQKLAPSLIALDKNTARLLGADDEKIGQKLFHGQWSSPSMAMVNGRKEIFFGGGDGLCYAFEPADPAAEKPGTLKKIWSFDCNPPDYRLKDGKPIPYTNKLGPSEVIATPVFYKDRVYVAVGQDTRHGKGKGILNCIDATQTGDISKTGKVWSCEINRSTSTVSIADGLLYILDFEGKVRCLDADTGQCYWTHDTGSPLSMGSTMVADGKVFLGTDAGDFWTLAAGKELKVIAKVHVGEHVASTPTIVDGVIYLASYSHLYAIGRRD